MKRRWVRFIAAVNMAVALAFMASCAGNPQVARLKYLQKGQAYMEKQQYSSAAIEFRNALKVDPRYIDAYVQLAKADLALRDGNGAYKALGQAISLDPDRADARIERAKLLIASGKSQGFSLATEDANYILKKDPQNADAHRILGSVAVGQKEYNQALQEFSKAAALAPNDAKSYLDLALVNLALRQTSDAELNLKKAVQIDPKSVPAFGDLANFYRLQNDPARAEQTLQEGIKTNPSAIPLYLSLAAVFESQGKQSDAQGVLDNLSAQQPKSPEAALGIGDFFLQAKMADRALAAYQKGLSSNSDNVQLQERIEDLYITTQKIAEAAKVDDDLLKQHPNDVFARINHGRILMGQEKIADAVSTLQKVAADNSTLPQAHYYLAMAYWQNHDLVQANSELQQTLRVDPSLPIALTALVHLNSSQGKYAVAQLYAQELLQKTPNDPSAHLMLGQILLKLGQNKQAGEQFIAAQKLAPNDPGVHANLASLYAAENNVAQAEKEFDTALHTAPGNASLVAGYANFLAAQKQESKANALVSQFVAQNPNQPDAHLLMGQIHMTEKNLPAALSETQKAISLGSKSPDAYLQMGQIYRDQGNNSAAIQAYEQSMTLAAPSAPVVTVVGNIYMQQGDLTKAAGEFQKALNLDPNFVVAANNLAWVYAEQNQNLDVALGLAQKAKSEQPQVPSYTDTLAWVMFRKGNYAGAIPLLQDCVKKSPDSAQFHFHLGMVLVADGQKTEGKAQLQSALHMNLDNQDAEQARKALSQ